MLSVSEACGPGTESDGERTPMPRSPIVNLGSLTATSVSWLNECHIILLFFRVHVYDIFLCMCVYVTDIEEWSTGIWYIDNFSKASISNTLDLNVFRVGW